MKRWKNISVFLLAVLLTGGIAACGSGRSDSLSADTAGNAGSYAVTDGWDGTEKAAEESYSDDNKADVSVTDTDLENAEAGQIETARKLIRNMDLSLETTGFDELLTVIDRKAVEMGGYVESSTVEGGAAERNRYAYLTVRIPSEQLEVFEELIGNSASVLSKSSYVQDVTLHYSDLEAHIASLRTEQQTLNTMLAKAENIDDIIAIQNELTSVRYQLESYESQMKVLENQVSYSTVNINISEVETPSVHEKEGFFSRLKYTFINSTRDLGVGIQNFLIFFFGNIFSIMIGLAAAAGALILLRWIFRFLFSKEKRGSSKGSERKRGVFGRRLRKIGKEKEEAASGHEKEDGSEKKQ